MLKRKITDKLLKWKSEKKNECLLIKGARQIGKTFSVREFGNKNYKSFVEINFEENPEYKNIFDGSLEVNELIQKISLKIPNVKFIENNTLIFLDEIQACPKARTALKFLAQDNRYDVIASGSLLGINYKEVSSYPVGYERQLEMHSLDFEEFLWALGISETVICNLKTYFDNPTKIPSSIHDSMTTYLRKYMIVGGMPAVVDKYLETNNFNDVHNTQQMILNEYLNDIAKYAPTSDKPKARNCYLSIPQQLAKENTKFQFSVVEKNGTSRKYANCLDWLRDANLIRYCYNVSLPEFPLVAYVRTDQFRIYVNDIGLLIAMYGYEMKNAIFTDSLKGHAKGGIYENLMADFLLKKDYPLIHYISSNGREKIEFFIEQNSKIVPIEVNSKQGSTTSLNKILENEDIEKGYKFTNTNTGKDGKKITLPLYLAMFL